MPNEGPFHRFVALSTDVFVLLREMFIVGLFGLLLFAPGVFKTLLTRVGISTLTTPIGDINISQVKDAGNTVAGLNRGLTDSVARLQQIQGAIGDPKRRQDLQDVSNYLQTLQQQAQATDESIKTSLVTQQASAPQTAQQSAQVSGWLFLGHVDKDKQHWAGDGPKNVAPTLSPVLTVGQRFAVSAPAYLHQDAPPGSHFGGKVMGVVPVGTQVEVIARPEYSSAIAGGFFLWVNVRRL
jgi:hypothetical protein